MKGQIHPENYEDDHVWIEVNKLMSAKFGSGNFSKVWPWYVGLPGHEFSSPAMKNWRVSEEPWVAIMNGDLVNKITGLANRVRKAFTDEAQLRLLEGVG